MLKMDRKGTFTRLEFTVPARGLIGVRSRLLNATAGQATMHHVFHGYGPFRGRSKSAPPACWSRWRRAGRPSTRSTACATAARSSSTRRRPRVYEGMMVGEHCKDNDLVVNVVREKKATNVRSSTKENFVKLPPPRVVQRRGRARVRRRGRATSRSRQVGPAAQAVPSQGDRPQAQPLLATAAGCQSPQRPRR
jgi:GTP-binding protein